jgi:hypothetical protein
MAAPDRKDWREIEPVPSPRKAERDGPQPMLVALIGPPGSGKTRSLLRMMRGVQRVFPGPAVLVDTEAGRSQTFSPPRGRPANPDDPVEPTYDFERIDLDPPFRSDRCWAAIKAARDRNPAAIGFDNLSDEHLGEGGYIEFHDDEVERMGGNEWGAWGRPSALRKRLCSGIAHIRTPPVMFFTFIAEEKTDQVKERDERSGREKTKIIKKGWTPVAPLLILKTMSLTCILPWDSKGTPIWEARGLPYEDFVRKWPDHLVRLMKQGQLTEDHGEALARWAKGEDAPAPGSPGARAAAQGGAPASDRAPQGHPDARKAILAEASALLDRHCTTKEQRQGALEAAFGTFTKAGLERLPFEELSIGLTALRTQLEGLAALRDAGPPMREPGED